MKKMLKEIVKDSLRFFGAIAVFDLLITVIVYQYSKNLPNASFSFGRIFALLFTNQEQELVINHAVVDAVLIIEKITEIIFTAVLTGFIFSRVINREINLQIRDTLLLRRRTSEGKEGNLNVHVLIGNKRKYALYNVRCEMIVITGNEIGAIPEEDKYNAAEKVNSNPEVLLRMKNYYTFSFPVYSLPNSFWKHYGEYLELTKNGGKPSREIGYWSQKDTITIFITGDLGNSGGQFRLIRDYHFKDLMFDKEILHPEFNKNKKRNWKFFQTLPGCASEIEIKQMKDELIDLGRKSGAATETNRK